MTTAQLIDKVRRLCLYDLDLTPASDGTDTTDAQIVQSINDAQNRLGILAPIFDPSIVLTLADGVATYDLTTACARRVFKVLDVVVGGLMLQNARGSKPGPWSMAELENQYSGWRTDASGIPSKWAHTSDRSIILHPAPNSTAVAAGSNYISGHVLPADLSAASPSGVSELPLELHEHLAKLAAAIEAEPVAKENSQFQKIVKWEAQALDAAAKMGSRDGRAKAPIGSTSGRSRNDFVRM